MPDQGVPEHGVPEEAAQWRERGRLLSEQIHRLITTGAGAQAHAVELELYALLRTYSSVRDAAGSAYEIALSHQASGDYDGAIVAYRDARSAFQELTDIDGMSAADLGVALMHVSKIRLDLALSALHESAGELLRLGAPAKAARAHISAATFLMLDRRYQDAAPELDTADRLLTAAASSSPVSGASAPWSDPATELTDLLFVAAIIRSRLTLTAGRPHEAAADLVRARIAAGRDSLFLAFVQDQRAQLAMMMSEREQFVDALEQAAARFLAADAPELAAVELGRIGVLREEQGDAEGARRALTQSAELLFGPGRAAGSSTRRVSPYLVVAELELDPATLARLPRPRG